MTSAGTSTAADALDHVVLVLFENRSFDNLLGWLYTPGEAQPFEGVSGKDLSNPIPDWAEHGRERETVPYSVATGMDSPNPDPGEEYGHTNTQLFNILDEANRFKDATKMVAPFNAPREGQRPTMDGFVTDYISFCTVELGRQPTYEQYSQIMTGYEPSQVPVMSAIARGFGVFDHWFSEVPSQTMPNRSFWTAADSSGLVVNRPLTHFMHQNDTETIFERLESRGKTWKVYVLEPDPVSFTGLIHMSRLRDRFATNFVPYSEFERDVASGTLPDFSLIEPNLITGHSDYHPAFGRALFSGLDVLIDPPSSILAGEAFLARIYNSLKSAPHQGASNVYNTALLIGFDEPGGTFDHVPPGPVPPPDPARGPGQLGFCFDRSGYRVPAILLSAWAEEGAVFTDEYRHTSLISTLRKAWDLGKPLSARDAAAPSFDHLLSLESPRDPQSWPDIQALPVPQSILDAVRRGDCLGTLGRHACHGLVLHARHHEKFEGVAVPDPHDKLSPRWAIGFIRHVARRLFPGLTQTDHVTD